MSTSIIASKSNSINMPPSPTGRGVGGEGTCAFCDEPPWSKAGYICNDPPLCAVHFDLTILVQFMQRHNEALTLENVTRRLEMAIGNGGQWALTPGDLTHLLPAYLKMAGLAGEKSEVIPSNKKAGFPPRETGQSHK